MLHKTSDTLQCFVDLLGGGGVRAADKSFPAFAPRWSDHRQARSWARATLQGVTTIAVDGSQITPDASFSIPLGAVQVGWFENPHDGAGRYVKDIAFALATPTELTTANGLVQTMAPPQMRGRLLSAFILVSFGIQPVSAVLIGFVADHYGTPNAILFNGAAMIVLAASLLFFRRGLRSWVPAPAGAITEPAYGSH